MFTELAITIHRLSSYFDQMKIEKSQFS